MTCINISHPEFQSLLTKTGKSVFELELDVAYWQEQQATDLFPTAQELYSVVKEGVKELFNGLPELAKTGTQEQYSQYLDTIFPDSKVKNIVYHGSYAEKIDKFSKEILGRTSLTGFLPKGFYFTNQQYVAATYIAPKDVYNRAVWSSLLNVLKGIKGERGEYIQDPISFEKLLSYIGQSNDKKEFIIDYRDGKLEDSFGGAAELGLFLPSKEDTELYLSLLRNKDLKGIENQRDKYSDKEGSIFPVILNIENPLNKTSATGSITTINLEGRTTGERKETLQKELKNSDGLIVNNIRDSSDYKPKRDIKYNENIDEQTYVVFEPEQIHILGSKQDIENFKKYVNKESSLDYYTDEDFKKMSEEYDNFLVEEYEYLSKPNEISYKLKAVEILNTTKAKKTFEKGEKNSWTLNKILTELQIPKEQRELILELGLSDRLDILKELQDNYKFSVEINTTTREYDVTDNFDGTDGENTRPDFIVGEYTYRFHPMMDKPIKYLSSEENNFNKNLITITEEEYFSVYPKNNTKRIETTKYYDTLAVPGGTNYTEQEIATPQIVPSIKGHAQFATSNGIGWFRSDESYLPKRFSSPNEYKEKEKLWREGTITTQEINIWNESDANTKTRRILEVQSDLFQKGRDLPDLTSNKKIPEEFNVGNNPYGNKDEFPYAVYSPTGEIWDFYKTEDEAKQVVYKQNKNREPNNQFLQLLNKNSNWVPFFIKAIVQDSVKKGYEKVLFPSGDTASKVEGHTTAEEFKKQKEDRLKLLEKDKVNLIERLEDGLKSNIKTQENLIESSEKEWQKDIHRKAAEELKLRLENKEFTSQTLKDLNNEINQLEQELVSVERDGLAALQPIWNFYENIVSKIAKKFYDSKLITDEYGNTWQEVTLIDENVVTLPENELDQYLNFDKICL